MVKMCIRDRYYYLAKKTERKTLDFFPRIGSYLYWATSGYGERPINAIVFSLIMMAIFEMCIRDSNYRVW